MGILTLRECYLVHAKYGIFRTTHPHRAIGDVRGSMQLGS